jgi:hypothetical protein
MESTMTAPLDTKKLRKIAEEATEFPKHFEVEDTFPTMWFVDPKGERHEIMNDDLIFWEAANPQVVLALLDTIERYKAALKFYADGHHMTEIDHDVIQVVPGSDEFIDHIVGRRAREALMRADAEEQSKP